MKGLSKPIKHGAAVNAALLPLLIEIQKQSEENMSQQTSRKTGLKSSAKKEDNTRHGTQPMPATQHQPGAFGKESREEVGKEDSPIENKEPALKQQADHLDESRKANA